MAFGISRASLGTAFLKFFKIGRLTFGSGGASSYKELFSPQRDDYRAAYEQNVWAYRGINAIASAAGRIPFKVAEKTAAGNLETVESHPLIALLENPNPFMTRQDIVELLFIFAESTGDGNWLLDDGGNEGRALGQKMKLSQVKEIWPLPSHELKPIPDPKEFVKGYRFKPEGQGKHEDFSVSEVLRIQYPSPCSMLQGLGALKPVGGDLAADLYAQGFERFIMKNLAANIIFLKTDGAFTPDQEEEYRRSLANVFKNVKIGFMQSGLDFATPQIAAKDLPFLELDARRQKRILGALGVPPIMAGSEDAKYDNADQQKRFFWGDTMRPKLNRLAGMLTKKLHALGESDRLVVIPDLSEVQELQPDAKLRAETGYIWRKSGVPLNDVIKHFGVPGMDEVEGGDVPMVESGLMPLEDAIDPAEEGELGPDPNDLAPKPGDNPKPEEEDPADEEGRDISGDKTRGPISDKALDDAHWKRFIATSEPGFRRLRASVKGFFRIQKKETLARLNSLYRSIGVPNSGVMTKDARVQLVLIDLEGDSRKLAKRAAPIIKSIYRKLGEQAIEDVGASIDFNIDSPRAVEFLTDHVFKFSFDVNKATRARLTVILEEKFAQGATQAEITKAIQAEFGLWERWRAARIARTESGIAGNSGIHEGMIQAGVTEKRWISSRDAKVRDTHKVADGQQVGIDEPFDVGGTLLDYPGDPNGPAEEIINCRCSVRAARTKI